jgi:hypothetical protein
LPHSSLFIIGRIANRCARFSGKETPIKDKDRYCTARDRCISKIEDRIKKDFSA